MIGEPGGDARAGRAPRLRCAMLVGRAAPRRSWPAVARWTRRSFGEGAFRMTDVRPMDPGPAAIAQPAEREGHHPATFALGTFILLVVLCVFGAVIGVQLILQLGITP